MLLTVSMEVDNWSYLQLLKVIHAVVTGSRLLLSKWMHHEILYCTNICLTALELNKLQYSAKQVDLHTW